MAVDLRAVVYAKTLLPGQGMDRPTCTNITCMPTLCTTSLLPGQGTNAKCMPTFCTTSLLSEQGTNNTCIPTFCAISLLPEQDTHTTSSESAYRPNYNADYPALSAPQLSSSTSKYSSTLTTHMTVPLQIQSTPSSNSGLPRPRVSLSGAEAVDGEIGDCAHCRKSCALLRSGLIHQHGPRKNPCSGSGREAAPGSRRPASLRTNLRESLLPSSSQDNSAQDLFPTSNDTSDAGKPIGHPSRHVPILKRIPRGARTEAANTLQQLLNNVVDDVSNNRSWTRLFGFAPTCLAQPGRGGKSRNLTTLVNRQIRAYDAQTDIDVGVDRGKVKKIRRAAVDENTEAAKRASAKLEEGDVKGAIRILTSKDKVAPVNEATAASLRVLHPPAPADLRPPPTSSVAPLQATAADVRAAITSFPNGSAGGPDGFRPQHLKDLVLGKGESDPLLEAVTRFVNLMLEGKTPEQIRPALFGGALTALQKNCGGVRPIAVGYTWRRLAGKVACRLLSLRASTLLAPRQLGFGVPGGAEAAVHATRRYLQNLPPGHVILKIDFSNAFNSVRRDVILEAVKQHLPELLPYASSCYAAPSSLKFGEHSLSSETGAQQGDPLGPLYFCLAVKELLASMKSELTIGYLDDFSLGDEAEIVADDFVQLEIKAQELGLTLNRAKCEVIGQTSITKTQLEARGICLREVEQKDAILLGSPLLPGVGVDKAIATKRNELETLASRLPLMPAHDSLFLLRNVVTTARLLYILRTAPCTGSAELLLYDDLLRSTLSVTLNVELTEEGWLQASLPVRWGGLGVRSAVSLAAPAYLASAAGTLDRVITILPSRLHMSVDPSEAVALASWQSTVDTTIHHPTAENAKQQKAWDEPCCYKRAMNLLDRAPDEYTRARLLAGQQKTSGAWLRALPISSVGLRMADDVIRVAVGVRLGTNLCSPHVCVCGQQVDARGTHGLACKRSAGRHPRHGLLNDIIWRAMQRAKVPASKEPTGLTRTDGKRPDGVTIIPWARGRCMAWDVTVPDTLAPSYLQASAGRAGVVAEQSEAKKVTKYTTITNTHLFIPLAFETLGVWGEQAQKFVSELGRRTTEVTKDTRETDFLRQRLSVAIQRGNALACLGSFRETAA